MVVVDVSNDSWMIAGEGCCCLSMGPLQVRELLCVLGRLGRVVGALLLSSACCACVGGWCIWCTAHNTAIGGR